METNRKSIEKDVELICGYLYVVFKTILTINAMKLMENEDVEPFSHFDVVFKTILTDNAEDVVFKTILKDVLVDDFVALGSGGGGAP